MLEKVCAILAEFSDVDAVNMTESSDILNDLGLNSLEILDAVTRFEDEFGIDIPDRAISRFRTVGDIALYLDKSCITDWEVNYDTTRKN